MSYSDRRRIICLDDASETAEASLEKLLAALSCEYPDFVAIDENATAELFYTSGSTGAPRGVMLSHRSLYLHAMGIAAGLKYDDASVELHTIPLFHANG